MDDLPESLCTTREQEVAFDHAGNEDGYIYLGSVGALDSGTVAVLRRHFLQLAIADAETRENAVILVADLARP